MSSIYSSTRKSIHKSVGFSPPRIQTFSPKTLDVTDKFPNPLANGEARKIDRVIRPMVVSGNYKAIRDLKDGQRVEIKKK